MMELLQRKQRTLAGTLSPHPCTDDFTVDPKHCLLRSSYEHDELGRFLCRGPDGELLRVETAAWARARYRELLDSPVVVPDGLMDAEAFMERMSEGLRCHDRGEQQKRAKQNRIRARKTRRANEQEKQLQDGIRKGWRPPDDALAKVESGQIRLHQWLATDGVRERRYSRVNVVRRTPNASTHSRERWNVPVDLIELDSVASADSSDKPVQRQRVSSPVLELSIPSSSLPSLAELIRPRHKPTA